MNGAADLGGMMGFGPIDRSDASTNFHADWERRVLALTLAMGATGSWSIDTSRFARESLPPGQYLTSGYYQIWLAGLQRLLEQHGLATRDEMDSGKPGRTVTSVNRVLMAADVDAVLAAGAPADRPVESPARFRTGDRVRTINMNPQTHTRLPRYLRAKCGRIESVHGVHVLPDTNAHGHGENPQWLYAVEFEARELWGRDGNDRDSVTADCWECYLEPV